MLASDGRWPSRVVGYSGPQTPLKGLFKVCLAEKARGSIPNEQVLEGLFPVTIGNRLGRCRYLVTVSRRVAADEHTNTNIIRLRDIFVPSKRP